MQNTTTANTMQNTTANTNTAMQNAWDACISALQGNVAQHVNIATSATQYDMGRAVGTFVCDDDDVATVATVAKASTKAKASNTAAASTKAKTKADIVRELIAAAKANNTAAADVVAQVVAQLNFTRALANVYVKNNWDKV